MIMIIIIINREEVKPNKKDIDILKKEFGDLKIVDTTGLIILQNSVINKIKHQYNGDSTIFIEKIINKKMGFCFDRSLLLQKILIYNKIRVRPVYLFYYHDKKTLKIYNFFDPKINSHNVFEFRLNGKWYLMPTSNKMKNLQTIDQYLNSGLEVPIETKFIRYLNNRNGRFIWPSWVPDLYSF